MLSAVRWNVSRKRSRFVEADVIVLSLGKSGRTWLRFMLHKYLSLAFDVPFDPIRVEGVGVPRITYSHELASHARDDRWQHRLVGKSILPVRVAWERRLVLLGRDPRDVIVSSFHHKSERSRRAQCSLPEFVRHPRWGIHGLVDVLNDWHDRFGPHPALVETSYEGLHADPVGELTVVLEGLGLPVDRASVAAAVQFASFDRMRAAETAGEWQDHRLRPGDPDRPDSFKVRRGRVGGYRQALDAASIAYCDRAVARLHPAYGYVPGE